jgi:hypothetical protein
LLFDRQSGLRRRLRALSLLGGGFGWRLEEITGNVVNDALLANMATTRRVSIRTHWHLPSVKAAFPLRAKQLPLLLDCLYVSLEGGLLTPILRSTRLIAQYIELKQTVVNSQKAIVFLF